MGDINAHHKLWFSKLDENARGTKFAEEIALSNYGTLNENKPTRIKNNCESSPDFTLSSNSLLSSTELCTKTSLGSDHLPIIVSLQQHITKIESERRTFINFSKANCADFSKYIEDKLASCPSSLDVHAAEKTFRKTINRATKRFVPCGRIPIIPPNFPTTAAKLADRRDQLRIEDPNNPQIGLLNTQISNAVKDHKQKL